MFISHILYYVFLFCLKLFLLSFMILQSPFEVSCGFKIILPYYSRKHSPKAPPGMENELHRSLEGGLKQNVTHCALSIP